MLGLWCWLGLRHNCVGRHGRRDRHDFLCRLSRNLVVIAITFFVVLVTISVVIAMTFFVVLVAISVMFIVISMVVFVTIIGMVVLVTIIVVIALTIFGFSAARIGRVDSESQICLELAIFQVSLLCRCFGLFFHGYQPH